MRRTRITIEVDWQPGPNVAEPDEWQWEEILPDVIDTPMSGNPIRNVRLLETTDITPGGEPVSNHPTIAFGDRDSAPPEAAGTQPFTSMDY